jgi:hypothetical protein
LRADAGGEGAKETGGRVGDNAPSVITLRGPAFSGLHVIELAARGNDTRGWRLVVDGREGGNLACGAVVKILGMLNAEKQSGVKPPQSKEE